MIEQLKERGYVELDFESDWRPKQTVFGPGRFDYGQNAVRSSVINAARAAGVLIKTRAFRLRDPETGKRDLSGGVLLIAPAEKADEVFTAYAEGWDS